MNASAPGGIDVIDLRGGFRREVPSVRRLPAWTATSVTLIRLPIAVAGVGAIAARMPVLAALLFVTFALIDYVDGVVARAGGNDGAARRAMDVVVDRVAIHSASLACVVMLGADPLVAAALLARDAAQGLYSGHAVIVGGVVFVGPKWHMLYGLAFLAWGADLMFDGEVRTPLTVALVIISAATFFDFVRRTRAAIDERANKAS